jgi:ATP-dependent helicase/nuclease subunit A
VQPVLAERESWQARLVAAGICPAATAPLESRPPLTEEKLSTDARARALGTAFHRIMQEIEIQDEPLLNAIIESAATTAGVAGDSSLLREWVRGVLASPLWRRVRQALRLWREAPFCIEQNGQVVEGTIDLLFQDPKGLVLVDYKTDEVASEATSDAIEAHRAQLELYRDAVKQLTGAEPIVVLIYFARTGCAVEV